MIIEILVKSFSKIMLKIFFSLFINKMQFFCKDWVVYNKQKSFFSFLLLFIFVRPCLAKLSSLFLENY